MKKLLVVDDDPGSRESLRMIFDRAYSLILCADAAEALQAMQLNAVDLVLMDVIMPGKDGVTLLKEVAELYPQTPVIMISASDNVRPVVESIKSGAYDFVMKPFDVEELRRLVARALRQHTMQQCLNALQSDLSRQFPADGLIGRSSAMLEMLDRTRRAAVTDATVLIAGESGTGKEMVARQLHRWSPRNAEPFVAVHCGALSEALMESELFGHEKGAFTGADRRKAGRFDMAGAGTLFFDEVAEMRPATQVKLLRVLQEREFMRVGGTQVIRTEARILAASHRDLKLEMQSGKFREDLYYRLNVVPIHVPPLRDRPEDIPLLVDFFLMFFNQTMHSVARRFAPDALAALGSYGWPGNVRELRNVIERTLVLCGHESEIPCAALPAEFRESDAAPTLSAPVGMAVGGSLTELVKACERNLIMDALRQSGGVQTRAAALLHTTRRILKYKMNKMGIDGARAQTRTPINA